MNIKELEEKMTETKGRLADLHRRALQESSCNTDRLTSALKEMASLVEELHTT
mgnify:CR=1 FL=1